MNNENKIYKPNFKCFESYQQASDFVGKIIVDLVNQKPNAVLGLATGDTPLGVYSFLVKAYEKKEVSFKNVKTFNLDEYVELKSIYKDQSYAFFMSHNLFSKVDINLKNTFFPNKSEDKLDLNKKDYSEYDKEIEKTKLDFQILGIGQNGHIGFNEPGTSLESKTRLVPLTDSTIKANSRFFASENDVPKYAVTMGIQTILANSKQIVLLAFGKNKKEALKALVNNKSFNKDWPCTALLLHPNVTIVCDKEANPL